MCDEMEQAGRPTANANTQHHVTQLADGGIGQHAFDVGRNNGNCRGNKQCDAANVGDDQ